MSGLIADSVVIRRDGRQILEGVSLAVRPGEFIGVLGPNGAGKSSLLACLAGELTPEAGRIGLDGRLLSDIGLKRLAQRRAVLPQRAELTFDMTVREVVTMGAYPFPASSPAEVEALIDDALTRIQLVGLGALPYPRLSGGEQQRVHLARVWVQVGIARRARAAAEAVLGASAEAAQGCYLFLDEPTASQDPGHQMHILRAVRDLAATGQIGVVAVLHDMNLAATWCDRVVLLAQRRVLADGPPQQVLSVDHIGRAYGIEAVLTPHPLHPGRSLIVY